MISSALIILKGTRNQYVPSLDFAKQILRVHVRTGNEVYLHVPFGFLVLTHCQSSETLLKHKRQITSSSQHY